MTRSRTRWLALAVLGSMLAVGCGGAQGGAETAKPETAKPEGASGEAQAMVYPTSARVGGGGEPRVEALSLRVWAPTPIGPLREDAREAYRIVLQAENVSASAVAVRPSWARARIQQRGLALEGCLGEPVRVPETSAVAPEGSLFVSLPAPCAVERAGHYDVFVDLSIGVPFGTDATAVRTARTELVVDSRLEPFRDDDLPPVMPDPATSAR